MLGVEPKDLSLPEIHGYLLAGVAPRPIALVSTVSNDNVLNLSPFSFYNAFGANPPTVAFSAARRGHDGSFKDTYNNLTTTKECVIHAVTYSMVHQVNLASVEWEANVDEFTKCGLTPIASDLVKPPRVKESPFQMECILKEIIHLGEDKGSGNLAICEVVKFHIAEDLLENNIIVPERIEHVGRNGGMWYTKVNGDALFKVPKPGRKDALGYDNLPDYLKRSHTLTANHIAQLASVATKPSAQEVKEFIAALQIREASEDAFYRYQSRGDYEKMLETALALQREKHVKLSAFIIDAVKCALDSNADVDFAWKALLFLYEQYND